MIESMMTFFKSGGTFMFPIASVGVVALAIALERFVVMLNYRRQIVKDTNQFLDHVAKNANNALETLVKSHSVLADTVREAAKVHQSNAIPKEEFEDLVSVSAIHSVRRLRRRTTVLSTLANVATLLGLLGTIMGLIQSFASVAQASGVEKSTLLAGSVSVAMNTTALGLIVAIPLLLISVFIENASSKAVESLQTGCATVLNRLYQKRV